MDPFGGTVYTCPVERDSPVTDFFPIPTHTNEIVVIVKAAYGASLLFHNEPNLGSPEFWKY